jgi:hypothetical protein
MQVALAIRVIKRALLFIAFWLSALLRPRTKFYEPTGAEVVKALRLAQVRDRKSRNAISG